MDYRNNLNYLFTLRGIAKIFGYYDLDLLKMNVEVNNLNEQFNKNEKNILLKVFNRPLYKARKHNLENSIQRAEAIVGIFEANPNKYNELSLTLSDIIEKAIKSASKHFDEKEFNGIRGLANSRINNVMRVDHIRISYEPDKVYFKDEPAKTSNKESQKENTKQNNAKQNNAKQEMNM